MSYEFINWDSEKDFSGQPENQTMVRVIGSGCSSPTSFPVKERMEESLWHYLSELQRKVAFLEQKIEQNNDGNKKEIIPIKNLRSKKIALKEPLYLLSEYDAVGDSYIISSADLNTWGYGETEQEAIEDFCADLEDFFFMLKKSKKLGKDLAARWDFLKRAVKEIKK